MKCCVSCRHDLRACTPRPVGRRRLGLFSYGSGCCAEFFTGSVPEGVEAVADAGVAALLAGRTFIDVPAYERLVRGGEAGGGPPPGLARGGGFPPAQKHRRAEPPPRAPAGGSPGAPP